MRVQAQLAAASTCSSSLYSVPPLLQNVGAPVRGWNVNPATRPYAKAVVEREANRPHRKKEGMGHSKCPSLSEPQEARFFRQVDMPNAMSRPKPRSEWGSPVQLQSRGWSSAVRGLSCFPLARPAPGSTDFRTNGRQAWFAQKCSVIRISSK